MITSNTQVRVLAVSSAAMTIVTIAGWMAGGWRVGTGALIGILAGFALYHASFGFTAAWRRFLREKRGAGLRAQFLLIVVTIAFAFPLMQFGRDFGLPVGGFVFPFGITVAIGAFMFGLGMQLGNGCGSGTLFTLGGGSSRMIFTLAAFIAGSLAATAHLPFWNSLPQEKGFSLPAHFGVIGGFILTAGALGLIAAFSIWLEKRTHGALEAPRKTGSFLAGPWSMVLGALMIAVVSVATLLVLGRPWGITSGFALWGAKIAHALGVDVLSWDYWKWQRAAVAERSVFADATSVMNFGIMAGAMAAAALAGKFAPKRTITAREAATAIAGGLLMGYGARLAFGCNIGAYLGGIISGSVHGWVWFAFALAGSFAALPLRRLAGMDPAKPPQVAAPVISTIQK